LYIWGLSQETGEADYVPRSIDNQTTGIWPTISSSTSLSSNHSQRRETTGLKDSANGPPCQSIL